MDYEAARQRLRSDEWRTRFGVRAGQLGRNPVEELTWLKLQAQRWSTLPPDFFQVWLAVAQEVRRLADFHEYLALQELHVNRGKSWAEVARTTGSGSTRQALQQRWGRLERTFTSESPGRGTERPAT